MLCIVCCCVLLCIVVCCVVLCCIGYCILCNCCVSLCNSCVLVCIVHCVLCNCVSCVMCNVYYMLCSCVNCCIMCCVLLVLLYFDYLNSLVRSTTMSTRFNKKSINEFLCSNSTFSHRIQNLNRICNQLINITCVFDQIECHMICRRKINK